ncbi:MAG TPA: twin-arginine translocase TatA/TatE family subunit [Acidimicrobiia bacterium]|jgi:TatA/E family protein of Tat protein translocase
MTGLFSPVHILIVLTVALIVLGPQELPKVARSTGKVLRELRALRARLDEEIQGLIDDDEPDPARPEQPTAGSEDGDAPA